MNVGIIILILVAIGLIVTIIVMMSMAWAPSSSNTPTKLEPCSQTTTSLITLPDNTPKCIQNGIDIGYYLGAVNPNWDYVVAPYSVQPKDVCVGFCQQFTNGTCIGPNYNGLTAQENYNRCIAQLSPNTCIPPLPVAIKDGIIYYPTSPTCRSCSNCNK